jgi:hypothetical protein
VLLPVKVTPELRKRFRLACVEDDVTYAEMLERFLDGRDAKLRRQQAQQAHPFHRPGRDAAS